MVWIAVFFANSVVLILEIVGARALTPYFGTSAEAWAGFIGVVLFGLTLGYWAGGYLGDRAKNATELQYLLSAVLAGAGVLIIALWTGSDALGALGSQYIPLFGLTTAAAITALPLLFLPSVLLAASSPIAVKALLMSLDTSARIVGRVSATAAAGSVLGSLGVGMILLPYLGSHTVLLGAGALMIVVAFLVSLRAGDVRIALISGLAALIAGSANLLISPRAEALIAGTLKADIDTRYGRIFVIDSEPRADASVLRTVSMDSFGVQCGAYVGADSSVSAELPYAYAKAFDVVFTIVTEPQSVLIIGGCNYSYPRHVRQQLPKARIDVVELDPAMTTVAKDWFSFDPASAVNPIYADGRLYVDQHQTTGRVPYDTIVVDAFNSILATPYQLLTVEAFRALRQNLNTNGVVVFNVISSIDGPGHTYTASIIKTLLEVYPTVQLYQIDTLPTNAVQNLIIVASPVTRELNKLMPVGKNGMQLIPTALPPHILEQGQILTDEYAPVEHLTKPIRDYVLYQR